ncbi:MAG: hypothetical protein Q8R82_18205 [Hyphomonadaceae bacterium]|nr:hypothetical protein [Hyphomonadaceae bacterium]
MQNDVSDDTQEHGFQRFMRERQVCRDAGKPKMTSEVKYAYLDEIGRLKSEVEKLGNICHTEMVNALNAMEFTAGKSRVADLAKNLEKMLKDSSDTEISIVLNTLRLTPTDLARDANQ